MPERIARDRDFTQQDKEVDALSQGIAAIGMRDELSQTSFSYRCANDQAEYYQGTDGNYVDKDTNLKGEWLEHAREAVDRTGQGYAAGLEVLQALANGSADPDTLDHYVARGLHVMADRAYVASCQDAGKSIS